jgi:hypothetical protein
MKTSNVLCPICKCRKLSLATNRACRTCARSIINKADGIGGSVAVEKPVVLYKSSESRYWGQHKGRKVDLRLGRALAERDENQD